jgi:hypothetical protein
VTISGPTVQGWDEIKKKPLCDEMLLSSTGRRFTFINY